MVKRLNPGVAARQEAYESGDLVRVKAAKKAEIAAARRVAERMEMPCNSHSVCLDIETQAKILRKARQATMNPEKNQKIRMSDGTIEEFTGEEIIAICDSIDDRIDVLDDYESDLLDAIDDIEEGETALDDLALILWVTPPFAGGEKCCGCEDPKNIASDVVEKGGVKPCF